MSKPKRDRSGDVIASYLLLHPEGPHPAYEIRVLQPSSMPLTS